MTEQPQLLDGDQIARFWEVLARIGAPVVNAALPGLSEAEMDELCEPLDLVLPSECKVWWGWRNGVHPGSDSADRAIGWWGLASLQAAVADTEMMREIAEEDPEIPPEFWKGSYVSLVRGEAWIAVDTAVDRGQPSPIRSIDGNDDRMPIDPHLPSLGSLVQLWEDHIHAGLWEYDKDRGGWLIHGKLPGVIRGLP